MKLLCLYSTREGQTKKILHRIARHFDDAECDFVDLNENPTVEFSRYQKIIIGASIRYGKLNPSLYRFIDLHKMELETSGAAFICVNLTARKESEGKDTPEGSVYVKTFLKKSPWQPSMIGVFAGALYYPRYKWFDRMMIKLIMTLTGGETDTTKEVEYTNWDKVDLFSRAFKQE